MAFENDKTRIDDVASTNDSHEHPDLQTARTERSAEGRPDIITIMRMLEENSRSAEAILDRLTDSIVASGLGKDIMDGLPDHWRNSDEHPVYKGLFKTFG